MPTSLSQWWSSLKHHPFIVVLSFVTVIALTVCVILFAPREYRSTSRLLLRIGHESATLDPTASITGDQIAPLHTREDEVETAIGVMHSRSIMEEVVDRVGVEMILEELPPADELDAAAPAESPGLLGRVGALTDPIKQKLRSIDPVSDRETAIRSLEKGFEISAPEKSSLVTIEYRSAHPQVAQSIVSAWVDSYLTHHAKVNRTQGTYGFFLDQDAVLTDQLEAAHQAVRDTKTRAGFATLLGQQKVLEGQLELVRGEILKVESELAESNSRTASFVELLESSIAKTMTEATTGMANGARDEMRSSLFALEVLENEYAAKYKDSHPKLVAIRDQLNNAAKIVNQQQAERTETRELANPTYQQINATWMLEKASQSALQEKKAALEAKQRELHQEIEELNRHEAELARLTREVEVLEERYKLHAVSLEQARLNDELEKQRITSINVVQPASFEERPISPDKKLSAIAGLFGACAIALSLPVLLDLRKILSTRSGAVAQAEPLKSAEASPPVSDAASERSDASSAQPDSPRSASLAVGEAGELIGPEFSNRPR